MYTYLWDKYLANTKSASWSPDLESQTKKCFFEKIKQETYNFCMPPDQLARQRLSLDKLFYK